MYAIRKIRTTVASMHTCASAHLPIVLHCYDVIIFLVRKVAQIENNGLGRWLNANPYGQSVIRIFPLSVLVCEATLKSEKFSVIIPLPPPPPNQRGSIFTPTLRQQWQWTLAWGIWMLVISALKKNTTKTLIQPAIHRKVAYKPFQNNRLFSNFLIPCLHTTKAKIFRMHLDESENKGWYQNPEIVLFGTGQMFGTGQTTIRISAPQIKITASVRAYGTPF